MMLKLTEAVINAWQTGKADVYIYVSFAPGVVAYMQRRKVTWKRHAGYTDQPLRVEDVETDCTLICFNSATHDDMNCVYVAETPEEIMAMGTPRSVAPSSMMQLMPDGSIKYL